MNNIIALSQRIIIPVFLVIFFPNYVAFGGENNVETAIAALNQKNYDAAVKHYSSLIQTIDNNASFYYGRGMGYYYLDKNNEAENDFTKAIFIDSNYADAYLGLSLTLIQKSQNQDALKALKKYIDNNKLDNKNLAIYYLRALLTYMDGDYKNAIEYYNLVINYSSKNSDALYGRAISYYMLNDFNNAKLEFTQCLQMPNTSTIQQSECQRLLSVINNKN